MNDRPLRLLRSVTLDLLDEFDPHEVADYEERVGAGEELAELIVTRAADVLRSSTGRKDSLPADEADARALVAAALTVGGKGHGVHRNVQHARKAYEELREPARRLSTAVLVRARRNKNTLNILGPVLTVREALLDGRPAPLGDQPEITALATAVVLALPGETDTASRLAARALDGAAALQASYEAAGAFRPESRVPGARTDLLGDVAALILPAAAREVCLADLVAAPEGPAAQGAGARAAMEHRVRELYELLRTCLTSGAGPMAQHSDADWLAWYDRCAARLAAACSLPLLTAGGDIVDVVACLHPWTRLDRTTTNRERTFPVDFQSGFGPAEAAIPRQGTDGGHRPGGAYDDVLDFDALLRTTVGRFLAPPELPPPPPALVHDWLTGGRPADRFSGGEMWSLVLALRSLVLRLGEYADLQPGEVPPGRAARITAALHARAKARGVGPEEAVRQPHHALAVLLPPLWTRRPAALLSV
ncbi:hypothetical protein ACWFQ8_32765, partial [Streptomyces sp. NPDC055254]